MKRIAIVRSVGDSPEIPGDVVSPGFALDRVEARGGAMPVDAVAALLSEVSTVEAAMRAEQLGYDGVLIADYGLTACRDVLTIPVVGTGQAGMLTAAGLGQTFGIVTIWPPSTGPVYRAAVDEIGLGSRFAGVRHVTSEPELATLADGDNFYTRMRAREHSIVERILTEIDRLVEHGADVVMLGCNCMTPVGRALAAQAAVPVVDPLLAGYRFLETLLALGLSHRPKLVDGPDRTRLFGEIVDAVVKYDDAGTGGQDCDVCVVTAAARHPEPR
jgi:allantoin racemase